MQPSAAKVLPLARSVEWFLLPIWPSKREALGGYTLLPNA